MSQEQGAKTGFNMKKIQPRKTWDKVKFPLLVSAASLAGIIANEYVAPEYIADNAGLIKQKIGEWGYVATPWVERIVVDGVFGAIGYRSIENIIKHDTSNFLTRSKRWLKRAAFAGLTSATLIAAYPHIAGKIPITYIGSTPSDPEAQLIARTAISQSTSKLIGNGIRYHERNTKKPVSFKEDLEIRVNGALAHRDIHYNSHKITISKYPELKNYDFDYNLTLAVEAQESGGRIRARSKAGAGGNMQYMEGTAKDDGLTINRFLDERSDPEISIPKAVDRLARLTLKFKSTELALASYNAGEGKTDSLIKKYGFPNFWKLQQKYLTETQSYVPDILATRDLIINQSQYGLKFNGKKKMPCNNSLPVSKELRSIYDIANETMIPSEEITRCNPSLRNPNRVPKGYVLKLP